MSNSVFPTLPGLAWNVVRKPEWSTTVKTARNGREYRYANWSYPRWHYKLTFEFLRETRGLIEMQTLAGFFNKHQGKYDSWLFSDPDDRLAVNAILGTGNGVTTQFQLLRAFGGYVEPIFDPETITDVQVNGVNASYTLGDNGVITLAAAPAGGAVVTWNGSFYWRCRFLQDTTEFNQFMRRLWDLKTLEFQTDKR